jgi:hypothetical protein
MTVTGDTPREHDLFLLAILLLLLGVILALIVIGVYFILRSSTIRVVDSDDETVQLRGVSSEFVEAYQIHRLERRGRIAERTGSASRERRDPDERIQRKAEAALEIGVTADLAHGPSPAGSPPLEFALKPDDYLAWFMYAWEKKRRSPAYRRRVAFPLLLIGVSTLAPAAYVLTYLLCRFLVSINEFPEEWPGPAAIVAGLAAVVAIAADMLFHITEESRLRNERSIFRWWLRYVALRMYQKLEVIHPDSPYQLWMDAEGLVEIGQVKHAVAKQAAYSQRVEVRVKWSEVEDIAQTTQQVFLSLGALGGIIVPKRAFPNEVAFADFADRARIYREDATRARPETD